MAGGCGQLASIKEGTAYGLCTIDIESGLLQECILAGGGYLEGDCGSSTEVVGSGQLVYTEEGVACGVSYWGHRIWITTRMPHGRWWRSGRGFWIVYHGQWVWTTGVHRRGYGLWIVYNRHRIWVTTRMPCSKVVDCKTGHVDHLQWSMGLDNRHTQKREWYVDNLHASQNLDHYKNASWQVVDE